jgi:hypothetical protein
MKNFSKHSASLPSAAQLPRKNNKLDPEVLQAIMCDLISKLHQLQSPVAARIGSDHDQSVLE